MEGIKKLLNSGSGVIGLVSIVVVGYLVAKGHVSAEYFERIITIAVGGNIAKRGLVDFASAFSKGKKE